MTAEDNGVRDESVTVAGREISEWDIKRLALLLFSGSLFKLAGAAWWVADLQGSVIYPIAIFALFFLGLVAMLAALVRTPVPYTEAVLTGLTLLLVGVGSIVYIRAVSSGYQSDALLFTRYAADLVLHGQNPYTASMAGAYEQFTVAPNVFTPRMDGSHVLNLNYPAVSFLYYIPFVGLGLSDIRYANIVLILAVIWLLYQIAPREYRVLVGPFFLATISQVVTAISGNDFVFILPLLGAIVAWERYERKTWSGVCLGIGAAAKQTVWFLAPFFLYRLYRTADGSRAERLEATARIGGVSLLAFLVPNSYFILLDPVAWVNGVFTPITGGQGAPLVIFGQGMAVFQEAGLTLLPRWFYMAALLVTLSLLGAVYVYAFEEVQDLLWIVPPIVMFFNYRGLGQYYRFFVPVALAIVFLRIRNERRARSVETTSPTPSLGVSGDLGKKYALLGAFLLMVTAVVGAAGLMTLNQSDPNAVDVEIVNQSDPNNIGRITEITIRVNNTGSETKQLATAVSGNKANVYYWDGGSNVTVGPGETRTLTLSASSMGISLADGETYFVRVNDHGSSTVLGESNEQVATATFPLFTNPEFNLYQFKSDRGRVGHIGWTDVTPSSNPNGTAVQSTEGSVQLQASPPASAATADGSPNRSYAGIQQITGVNATLCPSFDASNSTVPTYAQRNQTQLGVSVHTEPNAGGERELRILYARNIDSKQVETRTVDGVTRREVVYPFSERPPCVSIRQAYSDAGWELPTERLVSKYGQRKLIRTIYLRAFVSVGPDAPRDQYTLAIDSVQTELDASS